MLADGIHLFSIRGIPVRFFPIFLILLLVVGLQGDLAVGALWVGLLTFSILIHEDGTTPWSPSIFACRRASPCTDGEACAATSGPDSELQEALIIIAGPAAGFIFGFAVLGVQRYVVPAEVLVANPMLVLAFWMLFWVNIIWGLVNVVPLWPLDGGQLFRLGMVKFFGGATGERITHTVGLIVGVGAAIVGYQMLGTFASVLAAYWAWLNYERINSASASGPIYVNNRFAKDLGKRMRVAFDKGEYDEAYRLGQQIRAETNIDTRTLGRVWEVLGVVEALRDNYRDAWSYLKRAPERGRVLEARAACIVALELRDEARAFVKAGKHKKIPEHLRAEITALGA